MYLTDRAGAILRHHTRSSQEGHHTVKRTGVPKAMVAAVRVRARRGTARVPVVLPPPPRPQTSQGDHTSAAPPQEGKRVTKGLIDLCRFAYPSDCNSYLLYFPCLQRPAGTVTMVRRRRLPCPHLRRQHHVAPPQHHACYT